MSNTIRLHRVFSAPPERVYRALVEPRCVMSKMDGTSSGCTGTYSEHSDVHTGWFLSYVISKLLPTVRATHFMAITHEVIPNKLLRYTDRFDTPELAGEIEVTVRLEEVSVGTRVTDQLE